MSTIAVIPARYGSSRFPGKPLAMIQGKPMIQWVYERVSRVTAFDRVIVATDHSKIFQTVKAFDGGVQMTDPGHTSGTDRVWEVAKGFPEARYIFNVQGDEPLINPLYLEEAANTLKVYDKNVDIVTMKTPLESEEEVSDPNIVKVVCKSGEQALYFSRASIPFSRDPGQLKLQMEHAYRHIGVYGFTRDALKTFVQLPPSPLEQIEQLEQLRALEAGMCIKVLTIPTAPIGVDVPEDLTRIEAQLTPKN